MTPEFLPTSHALFMDTSEQFLPTFLWNGCGGQREKMECGLPYELYK